MGREYHQTVDRPYRMGINMGISSEELISNTHEIYSYSHSIHVLIYSEIPIIIYLLIDSPIFFVGNPFAEFHHQYMSLKKGGHININLDPWEYQRLPSWELSHDRSVCKKIMDPHWPSTKTPHSCGRINLPWTWILWVIKSIYHTYGSVMGMIKPSCEKNHVLPVSSCHPRSWHRTQWIFSSGSCAISYPMTDPCTVCYINGVTFTINQYTPFMLAYIYTIHTDPSWVWYEGYTGHALLFFMNLLGWCGTRGTRNDVRLFFLWSFWGYNFATDFPRMSWDIVGDILREHKGTLSGVSLA